VVLFRPDAAAATLVVNSPRGRVVIVRDIQPAVDVEASTAPDHVEPFPKDVTKLLAADPVFLRVSHFKGASFLGHVRSLEHSANLDAVATRGLVSVQSTRQFTFPQVVMILELDHNAVLKTALPSMLYPRTGQRPK
jgi:hypothetical protein